MNYVSYLTVSIHVHYSLSKNVSVTGNEKKLKEKLLPLFHDIVKNMLLFKFKHLDQNDQLTSVHKFSVCTTIYYNLQNQLTKDILHKYWHPNGNVQYCLFRTPED